MITIGAYEAKSRFPALLKKVLKGEYFIITRHGVPVAKLSPVEKRSKEQIKQSIELIKEFRKGRKLGKLCIKDMIEEGRRF